MHSSVAKHDDAVRSSRGFQVMRHEHDSRPRERSLVQQIKHASARFPVERAGRLICEHNSRPRRKHSRNGYTLLLSARELARQVIRTFQEANGIERREGIDASLAREPRWERNILFRAERRNEIEGLKDEADPVPPHLRELSGRQSQEIVPQQGDCARCCGFEAREAIQQRRLAGSAWADNRDELPRRNRERNVIEH